jgi:hypothetical protein
VAVLRLTAIIAKTGLLLARAEGGDQVAAIGLRRLPDDAVVDQQMPGR